VELSLHAVGQEAPGQEAIQPLGTAVLDLDGKPRRPVQEAHAGRGFVHMLPARSGGADEGLFQVLFMDLEGPQARLKRTLFFLTNAELTHLSIHRSHGNNVTSQRLPLPKRLEGQLDVLQGENAVDDGLDTPLAHQVHGFLKFLLSRRAGAHDLPFVAH
jgi:hypothetical protein